MTKSSAARQERVQREVSADPVRAVSSQPGSANLHGLILARVGLVIVRALAVNRS